MAIAYDFKERLIWSEGFLGAGIERILKARIPGAVSVTRASLRHDKNGTDYWVERKNGKRLSVDVKARQRDFAPEYDDLALETWSSIGDRPGWTRDESKQTDYVLWFWTDTGRFFLANFPCLCNTFARYWRQWVGLYQVAEQDSGGWQSQCVFVPRSVVMDKMAAWQSGTIQLVAAQERKAATP